MDIDAFMSSLGDVRPPGGLSDTLVSLWWDRQGQWDRAHTIAQDIATVQGSAVHAYLHREEGRTVECRLLVPEGGAHPA